MSRTSLLLLVILAVIVGVLLLLHSMAHEVPQTRVEKPVPDAVLAH